MRRSGLERGGMLARRLDYMHASRTCMPSGREAGAGSTRPIPLARILHQVSKLVFYAQSTSAVISGRTLLQTSIVQELCESRGGRPGLSVLTNLLFLVDVKLYRTMLRYWSQLVPNMSTDI